MFPMKATLSQQKTQNCFDDGGSLEQRMDIDMLLPFMQQMSPCPNLRKGVHTKQYTSQKETNNSPRHGHTRAGGSTSDKATSSLSILFLRGRLLSGHSNGGVILIEHVCCDPKLLAQLF